MATAAPPVTGPTTTNPEVVMHGIRERPSGWLSWLTTLDHKRIGIMYLVTTFVFFLLGGVEALLIRLQLGAPDNTLLSPQTYNALRSEEHTSELQSRQYLVCRLLLEKKKKHTLVYTRQGI